MTRIIDNKVSNQLIKDTILKQIIEPGEYPYFYSVLQFGFYDNLGYKLPYSEIAKFWDKTEVKRTNRLIKNMLSEAFGIECFWFFIERHTDSEQKCFGGYHKHILIEDAPDSVWLNPTNTLKTFMASVNPEMLFACHFGQIPPVDQKIALLKRLVRDLCLKVPNGMLGMDIQQITNLDGVLAYCSKQFGMNMFGQPHTWYDVLDTKNSIELNLKYLTDQYTKKSTHATYEYLYHQELIKRFNCLTTI